MNSWAKEKKRDREIDSETHTAAVHELYVWVRAESGTSLFVHDVDSEPN